MRRAGSPSHAGPPPPLRQPGLASSQSAYDPWGNDDPSPSPADSSIIRTSITSASASSGTLGASSFTQLDGVEGFNSEFQRLLLQLSDDRILKDEKAYKMLYRIAVDFKTTARAYGTIIIAEKHLPNERKSIKPDEESGGVGGGEKYKAAGIFFKFANDAKGVYGSDEFASKAAGHELRGLKELVKCGIDGLLWPLTAVLDYLGSRLVCVSFFDAINGNSTLVSGSSNAGGCILFPRGDALVALQRLSAKLNLRPHRVNLGGPELMYGPADLEVHSVDGRLLAIDFARLMPPDPTLPTGIECKNPYMTFQLRPELVRSNTAASLSSDALTGFASPDDFSSDARDLAQAATRLFGQKIPEAASEIALVALGEVKETMDDFSRLLYFGHAITRVLHKHGVNIRYLGKVWAACLANAKWRRHILSEAVARCMKQRLRAKMRAVRHRVGSITPYLITVAEELNLLGHAPCSRPPSSCACRMPCRCRCTCDHLLQGEESPKQRLLCSELPQMLSSHFSFPRSGVLPVEAGKCQCCACTWSRVLVKPVCLARVAEMLGVELSPNTLSAVVYAYAGGGKLFEVTSPIDEGDVLNLNPVVNVLPFLDYCSGTSLLIRARSLRHAGSNAEADRLATAARAAFDAGLEQAPDDPRLLCNLGFLFEDAFGDSSLAKEMYEKAILVSNGTHGRSLYYLALNCQKRAKGVWREEMLSKAEEAFERALSVSPHSANLFKDAARFYFHMRHDSSKAQALLERCLSIEPDHLGALDCFGEILENQGKLEEALVVRRQRLTQTPAGDAFGLVHLGKCQARLGNREEADLSLLEAVDVMRMHRSNAKQTLALSNLVKTAAGEFDTCNEVYHQIMNGLVEICLVHSGGDGGDQLVSQAVSILVEHAKRLKNSASCMCFEDRDAEIQRLFETAVKDARAHGQRVKRAWEQFEQRSGKSFSGGESRSSSSTGGGNNGGVGGGSSSSTTTTPSRHKLRADSASTQKSVGMTSRKMV